VTEADKPEWDSATSYVVDDEVMVLATHKIYKCQVDNTNKYPPDYLDDGDPDADPVVPNTWAEVSATNRWKMFDGRTHSQTVNAESIELTITPGVLFNGLGLLNIEAKSVTITVNDPVDGEVYKAEVDMADYTDVTDYYPWFFFPMVKKTIVTKIDLPAYSNASITITLSNPEETAKLGELIIGAQKSVGVTVFGTSVGFDDYSQKDVDKDTGEVTIKEGEYAFTVDYKLEVDPSKVYDVRRFLAKYRATPILYIGTVDFEDTVAFGFHDGLNVIHSNRATATCSLEVTELS
jgi:hypothetical protein